MMKKSIAFVGITALLMMGLLSVAGFGPVNLTPIADNADLRIVNALVGIGPVDV